MFIPSPSDAKAFEDADPSNPDYLVQKTIPEELRDDIDGEVVKTTPSGPRRQPPPNSRKKKGKKGFGNRQANLHASESLQVEEEVILEASVNSHPSIESAEPTIQPPSIPVSKQFPDAIYPSGEIQEYLNE